MTSVTNLKQFSSPNYNEKSIPDLVCGTYLYFLVQISNFLIR